MVGFGICKEHGVKIDDLKGTCEEIQEHLQNMDTEITEALEMVDIASRSLEDGGLKCILYMVSSHLRKIVDIEITDTVNVVMDMEAGLQIYKEENTDMSNEEFGSLGPLPGLTMQTVEDSEGSIVELENKPKRKYKKKKEEVTLEDIFSDEDVIKI